MWLRRRLKPFVLHHNISIRVHRQLSTFNNKICRKNIKNKYFIHHCVIGGAANNHVCKRLTQASTHGRTHTRTHTHARAHAHAHPHPHAHAHAHTNTHTIMIHQILRENIYLKYSSLGLTLLATISRSGLYV